ncbi:hypothetical protein [Kribbella swartbergensis]
MTPDLIPPEQDLPLSVRSRRREELLTIIAHETRQVRRLPLAPTLIASAAVGAVITVGLIGFPAYMESDRPAEPTATADATRAPAIRNLTAAEISATLTTCTIQTNAIATGTKNRFTNTQVVDAFTFTEPPGSSYTKTWLVGRSLRRPDIVEYEICGLDAKGRMVDASAGSGSMATPPPAGRTPHPIPTKAPASGTWVPSQLTGLVAATGRSHGRFSLPVARVTVQTNDSTEIEAVVRNGFWFAPIKGNPRPFAGWNDLENTRSADTLEGIYPGVRLRGYSATGQLLYDSERDADTFADCFPSGIQSRCPGTPWMRADPSR